MSVRTISHDNLFSSIKNDEGITLLAGTSYTKGMIIVKQSTGKYTNADVVLSGVSAAGLQLSYDEQTVLVLADDYDALLTDVEAAGYTGVFNKNKVTFAGSQTFQDVAGILQAKDIILKEWSI